MASLSDLLFFILSGSGSFLSGRVLESQIAVGQEQIYAFLFSS